MLYLTGVSNPKVRAVLDTGRLGLLNTPSVAYAVREGWTWAADSGLFNAATYVGDDAYLAWLARQPHKDACLFATAPDVVGDATASLERSRPFLAPIRALGYPVALVTQDGLVPNDVPWPEIDWLFIGGTNAHKLGPEAKALIAAAKDHGKKVHVGRVNSWQRYSAFAALGCDTCDGTKLAFGPDVNLPMVMGWVERNRDQLALAI